MGHTLSRAEIESANDIRTEIVSVPEWGGDVAVRQLTGAERDAFEAGLVRTTPDGKREPDLSQMTAKLVAACMVDGVTGDRLFSDSDVERLASKSATALRRVFDAAQKLNGMGAGAVEAVEKNSTAALSGSSISG
jgi:hypothetical protein